MKKPSKILIGIIAAVAALVVVIISIVMTVTSGSRDTYNSHMELAQRYLDELQYEQAIAEYEAAIAIEPKNPEAYLGLAEVYVVMGDTEMALEVLAEGYEKTESARIAARQEELAEELAQERGDLSEMPPDGEGQASGAEDEQTGEVGGNVTDEEVSQMEQMVTFIPWSEAGREDHVMEWQDEDLENCMREITGISNQGIMLSDVWELTELDLRFGYIRNINALSELINLTELRLMDNQIDDINALRGLTNLTVLDLGFNQINDISALSGLTNLFELRLKYAKINDISALSGLVNLTVLDLYGIQINDISALSGLTNLTILDLTENQISDISALSGLTKLTELYLRSNQISDTDMLRGLTNLRILNLSENQISNIDALGELKNLTFLALSGNQITDYSLVEFVEQNGGYLSR